MVSSRYHGQYLTIAMISNNWYYSRFFQRGDHAHARPARALRARNARKILRGRAIIARVRVARAWRRCFVSRTRTSRAQKKLHVFTQVHLPKIFDVFLLITTKNLISANLWHLIWIIFSLFFEKIKYKTSLCIFCKFMIEVIYDLKKITGNG